MSNKIKFGLSKAHYAVISYSGGVESYGTPVPIPGSVSLNISPEGEETEFNADNIDYFYAQGNNGYSGDMEFALIPDHFRKAILGEVEDQDGVIAEYADVEPKEFALIFQFEGDENATAHALYRCVCKRPEIGSQTKGSSITPVTEKLSFRALPRISDHLVRSKVGAGSNKYTSWFSEIKLPDA